MEWLFDEQFSRRRHASKRDQVGQARNKILGLTVVHPTRRNGIDTHFFVGPVAGQISRKTDQRRLHYGISDGFDCLHLLRHTGLPVDALIGSDEREIRRHVYDDSAAAVAAHMAGRHIVLECDLGLGSGESVVLGTDLGYGYIDENRTTS